MAKAKKTHGTVRDVFKKDFADPEFVVLFDEERAKSELALAVAKARKEAGLSQAELAKKASTSQSAIARLESGKDQRTPSLPVLARIAEATGKRLVVSFEPTRR